MVSFCLRAVRAQALFVALVLIVGLLPARAAGPEIDGRVIDVQSGLPLAHAVVTLVDRSERVLTDADGRFSITGLGPGLYTVRGAHLGYQTADTGTVALDTGAVSVTIALSAIPTESALRTIGRSSTTPGAALQTASTISRTISPESLLVTNVFRAGDALRQLPGVNNGITGDTAALSDDVQISFRGIGTLETLTTIDGHPVGFGVPGGYNFQISPLAELRSMVVTYGSGVNYLGYSAIGGTVDMQTLDPTPDRRENVEQGYGSFSRAATTLQATGTDGRLGYAFAYGVDTSDGPINNDVFNQPSAAFDQSVVRPGGDPAVRALDDYRDDSLSVDRDGLLKLRYAASPVSSLTLTGLADWKWVDKTGNGDGDYLPYQTALATGEGLLAAYKPANYPQVAACPAGTFVATNANGAAKNSVIGINGYGPNGLPDGGLTCQTPQQYAQFNTGFQGVGPRYQTFAVDDAHLTYESTPNGFDFRFDAFTNRYNNFQDRLAQLPFVTAPGDTSSDKLENTNVGEAGVTGTAMIVRPNNDIGIGYTYLNTAYLIQQSDPGTGATSLGTPYINESGLLFRDIYHPVGSPLTAYLTGNFEHSGGASLNRYIDPKAALVYRATPHDIVRAAAGATTTQPAGNELDEPFTPTSVINGGGGATIKCGTNANTVASLPSSVLQPERGVDEDVSYGHSFNADSQVQFTLYNVNVYNKIYSATFPLTPALESLLTPAEIAAADAAVGPCGGNPLTYLAVKGNLNVGTLQAKGLLLNGRQRVAPHTFFDYDYTIDSTDIVSIPTQVLKSNLTLVPGAQLPNLPLHTGSIALDQGFARGIEVRYTLDAFSANNSKNLPGYTISNLRLDVPVGTSRLTFSVQNLFNQYSFIEGMEGLGVPLALNQYATASSYQPYIGASATEQFGLPARGFYVNYGVTTH